MRSPLRVNLCRDPALVTTTCLRVRTRRWERYWWIEDGRIQYLRLEVGAGG